MSNSWSLVPGDILSLIVEHLSLKDLVRLSVIWKTWRPIVLEAIRHHPIMNMPWLTWHDPCTSTIRIGPICNHMYEPQSTNQACNSLTKIIASNEVNQLLGSTRVCASRYGWLLLLETKFRSAVMYFYNPYLNSIIDVPSLPLEICLEMHGVEAECVARVTFTAPPTSPDCVIFAVSERRTVGHFCVWGDILNVKTCILKDGRWSTIYTTDRRIPAHVGDVVYIDGVLHCLYYTDTFLKIVTCNVELQDRTEMNYRYFESSPKLATFGPYWPAQYVSNDSSPRYCLVESTDGDLFLAIRSTSDEEEQKNKSYWQVYRFDLSKYEWNPSTQLGKSSIVDD